ncbi:hypothetical protein BV898_13431 [Hypsibius exemplaris]|uniref:Receptor ligand binding region domain-containing protein n=1 Tax=Hypsibius exemplaris TaxID=2072580 RepID=A0A1W0WAX5_HYPEX|nr:hypothetical protein BV898_13431 [Hypsibius exemplaris]
MLRPFAVLVLGWKMFIVVQSNLTAQTAEVALVAYGSTAPYGLASLLRSIPLYQLAVEELNHRHANCPGVNFTFFMVPARNCLGMVMKDDDILAKWYYELRRPGRIVVFITVGTEVGCNVNDVSAYTAARDLNSVIINSLSGLEINRALLPTTLSLSYICTASYVNLCTNLIRTYNWTSVFILWDKSSAPINGNMATALQERLTGGGRVVCTFRSLASDAASTFAPELTDFQRASRVFFFFGHGAKLRRLLITASLLNMTDGSFVYISTEPLANFIPYGRTAWRYNDTNDLEAKGAFRSLIILQPAPRSNFKASADSLIIQHQFNQRSLLLFNATYTEAEHPLEIVTSTFDAVILLGQVVLEALRNGDNPWNATQLIDRFRNRTFRTEFDDFHVDSDGVRVDALAVTHYNVESERRDPFLTQYADGSSILKEIADVRGWPNSAWPPPNEPICGFIGNSARCEAIASPLAAYFAPAFSVVGIMAMTFVILVRLRYFRLRLSVTWWFLDPIHLISLFRVLRSPYNPSWYGQEKDIGRRLLFEIFEPATSIHPLRAKGAMAKSPTSSKKSAGPSTSKAPKRLRNVTAKDDVAPDELFQGSR